MSESSQAGKGDDPRNIGPAFREHFPEVDWRDKRPQRTCANCSAPIKTSGYAIVGSNYYCDSACARGVVKWTVPVATPAENENAETLGVLMRAINLTDENRRNDFAQ